MALIKHLSQNASPVHFTIAKVSQRYTPSGARRAHTTWRAGPVNNIRSDDNEFCKRVTVEALEFLCIEFMANIPLNFSPALLTNNLSALKNGLSYCAVDQV